MTKFTYYGGKKINDPQIIEEIKNHDNSQNNQDDDNSQNYQDGDNSQNYQDYILARLKLEGEIECFILDKMMKIELKELLGDGGEGAVFKTNLDEIVAKIYWPHMRTIVREEKITYMFYNQIDSINLCWPKGILKCNGKFVGFIMPLIDSKNYVVLNEYMYDYKERAKFFKDDRHNELKMLINLMNVFEELRTHNIVMGDVNFRNIMIKKNSYDIVLMDLDGAQIDKYPCLTTDEQFNAPEVLKNAKEEDDNDNEIKLALMHYHHTYSTFLRDNYSLAYIVFKIMMDSDPYNDILDTSHYKFGYDLLNYQSTKDNNKNEYCLARWSHLPYFMRELLHKCFTTKNPNKRLNPSQWKTALEHYLKLLDSGELKAVDKDYLKIYPNHKDLIDFNKLSDFKLVLKESINFTGFTIKDIIKKFEVILKKYDIEFTFDKKMISEYLKYNRMLKIDHFTFKILFNIGVLKKVALEYVCS